MPLTLVRDDISRMQADCIVVAANRRLVIDGGVGAAVAEVAGFERLQAACLAAAPLPCGECVLTPAFDMPARHIAHTVGPVWHDGSRGEDVLLAKAYAATLEAAWDAGDRSIALPLISTGSFGFPVRWAFDIAVAQIERFLDSHDEMDVRLVLWGRDARACARDRYPDLNAYLSEKLGQNDRRPRRGAPGTRDERMRPQAPEALPELMESCSPAPLPTRDDGAGGRRESARPRGRKGEGLLSDIEALLRRRDKPFCERLVDLIDERGMKDSEVYKRANISRQLFSKIRNNPGYRPTKKIAVALAVALRLEPDEMRDFIARAGLAMSGSSAFDIIVEYHVVRGIYDVGVINETLFAFDQELLGSSSD